MSRIDTSTNIIGKKKEGTASTIMTNSVKNLKPSIHKLIRVITGTNITIDGDCVMAVAFQQQGILTLKDLQMFDYKSIWESILDL